MGGLLPDWNNYHDSVNSVSRPQQMGPVWMHAKQLSGMPLDYTIWMRDPPATSYPACVSVKCAMSQSPIAGEQYLRLLRENVMMHGKNIAKKEILIDIGRQLEDVNPDFSCDRLIEDIGADSGLNSFKEDIGEVKTRNINRFPSLLIKNNRNKAILIDGYRPYEALLKALAQLDVTAEPTIIEPEAYKKYWGSLTERELAEIGA